MNLLYPIYFDFKLWLKSHTPLARIADKRRMGIGESDAQPEAGSEVQVSCIEGSLTNDECDFS